MTFNWSHAISTLLKGGSLEEDEAAAAMVEIMEGAATPAQIAGFVIALRAKGESTDEMVGLVKTMRHYAAKVRVRGELLDTCGTGGDRAGTFNVSTAAALVCAGAGVRVAKHGNRAASSRCGSADVLEALGVRIDLPAESVAACIEEAGIGFCFAPIFHPSMRHAGAPRRELGVATVFNFLGPLTNPAGAARQAIGVSDEAMLDRMVEVLHRLGSRRVLAFHGHAGIDELTVSGPARVVELDDGRIARWVMDPAELGFAHAPLEAVAGGTAQENAGHIRAVLGGETGARRDIVVLNAAAGLVAAGRAAGMADGVGRAAAAIDDGAAARALDDLVRVSTAGG
ncbi:MAG: anthranilate phosphoribosyltransferase [Actinomycetota bacterium]